MLEKILQQGNPKKSEIASLQTHRTLSICSGALSPCRGGAIDPVPKKVESEVDVPQEWERGSVHKLLRCIACRMHAGIIGISKKMERTKPKRQTVRVCQAASTG